MKRKWMAVLALVLGLSFSLWGCAKQVPEQQLEDLNRVDSPEPTGAVQPELPAPEILALEMEPSYPLTAEQLAYTLIVPQGEKAQVVLVPCLEQQTDQGWQPVQCGTGFCGNPDTVEGHWEGALRTEWYPDLTPGTYRLSFQAWQGEDSWPKGKSQTLAAQFQLTEE